MAHLPIIKSVPLLATAPSQTSPQAISLSGSALNIKGEEQGDLPTEEMATSKSVADDLRGPGTVRSTNFLPTQPERRLIRSETRRRKPVPITMMKDKIDF